MNALPTYGKSMMGRMFSPIVTETDAGNGAWATVLANRTVNHTIPLVST